MKTKRLIALVLALTFMFCFMAMSASAATVEVPVVQPRASCPQCGGQYFNTTQQLISEIPVDCGDCSNIGANHVHYERYWRIRATCVMGNCGYVQTSYITTETCPHA